MLEKTLEAKIKKYICSLGGRFYKWVSPGEVGVPDRICILPGGKIIFVELKCPGRLNGLSVKQQKIFRILKDLGCKVWLINSEQDFKEKLSNEI